MLFKKISLGNRNLHKTNFSIVLEYFNLMISSGSSDSAWVLKIRFLLLESLKWLTDIGENVQKWTRVFSRRSDASEKREENRVVALRSLFNVFACGQVSSPRLYRLNQNFNFSKFHEWKFCYDLSHDYSGHQDSPQKT